MARNFDFRYTVMADGLAQLSEVTADGSAVHTYVAGRKGSAMLIDTGFEDVGSGLIAALEKAGWTAGDFRYLVITHEHWDHYGAIAELRAWAKDAKVVSHIYCGWLLSQRWTRFVDTGWRFEDSGWMYGPPSQENFAAFEASEPAPVKIDQIIWNENTLEVGGATWRALHVPGHAQGHILLYRESDKAVIAGDMIQGCTESGRWLGLLVDVRSQRQSLARLRDLKPSVVGMGHHSLLRGEMIEREIGLAIQRVDDIVESARRGLKAGINDPRQLVLRAYKEILNWQPEEAPQHMMVTMRSALAQLCQEGQVRMERGDCWRWVG